MGNVNGLSLDLLVHPGETIKEVLEEKNKLLKGGLGDGSIPDNYDSREHNNASGHSYIPPEVRDQGSEGACWAFSTIGMFESSARKN